MHSIYEGLDEGHDVRMVFLDVTKAFDRVWHQGILYKLSCLGVSTSIVNWVKSYLTQRQQCVILNGCCSGWREIQAGVPQGSILGPLLFLVYINDLPEYILSKIFLFADDTSLMTVAEDPMDAALTLRCDLSTLSLWSNQ